MCLHIRRPGLILFILLAALAGCGPSAPPGGALPAGAPSVAVARTLVMAVTREPSSLADKNLIRSIAKDADTSRGFNAGLALKNDRNIPTAYLAETLPQIHTPSWKVSSDGRMETTFRLRPDLTWQDGVPLTADDFVFGWRVYSAPAFGYADSPPVSYMEEVAAEDPRTVVIRWRQPYPDAVGLEAKDFGPLPRHLIAHAFQPAEPDLLLALPFWTEQYVGLGPYRLEQWQRGAFVEGSAFAGHALGPPGISRIKIVFMGDSNTVLANLLSGSIHLADSGTLSFDQGLVLQRDWAARNEGRVLLLPVDLRFTLAQFKPEFASPPEILDVRVRRALAHAAGRQDLVDGLLGGQARTADTLVLPQVEYFTDLDRALSKYPQDERRVQQLMAEAGFERGADGFYANVARGRFSAQVTVSAGNNRESEGTILVDSLRRSGLDFNLQVLSQLEASDREVRSSFSGLSSTSNPNAFEPPVQFLRASEIPTPANHWRGSNRGGWVNAQFEQLAAAFDTTLDRTERNQRAIDLLKLVSDEVPGIPLYYNLAVSAQDLRLRGALGGVTWNWNIHEWEWSA